MQETKNKLTEGPIIKAILVLAFPVVLANVLHTAYHLIDLFWVGRLGSGAIAAVSLSFPIIFLILSLGMGLATAGTILVAQYKGKKQRESVNYVAAQTMFVMFFVSIFLTVLGYFLSPQIIKLMGVGQDLFSNAVSYLRISFLGVIFLFGFFVFQSLMRGVGDVKTPLYIVIGTVVLNVFLDPLFIFGFGIIPSMGISGAAIATVITQGLSAIIGLSILFSGKYDIHLKKKNMVPDFKFIKKLFRLGMPAAIEQSTRSLAILFIMFLVTGFGTAVIAAYGIGTRILGFAIIPAIGLSIANSTVVGQNMGASKIERAEKVSKISASISFVSLTILGIFVFVFAKQICAVFSPNDPVVIEMSAQFVRLISLFFGFIGIQQVFNGTFRAAGSTLVSMVLAIIGLWFLRFPLTYFLSQHTSLSYTGIWLAFPISTVVACIISWLWFLRGSWKHKRITEEIKLIEEAAEESVIEEEV